MLDLARRKAAGRRGQGGRGGGGRGGGDRPVPDYRWADAQDLPFDDGSFDVVSIAFGIRNVADPDRALGEFRRVLRPGGRLAVLEFCEPRNRLMRAFNRLYTQRIMPRTATWLSGDRTGAYHYLPRSINTFLEPAVLAARIRRAGFDVVEVDRLFPGLCACYIARIEGT
jgi:demethylmenaquinone methyltransferase/2-methoxy-6-polyprenyl-1,4-benzoquinol methylase